MPSPIAEVLASGLGAAITDTIFNPLEMLKVRVQTSQVTVSGAARDLYSQGGLPLLWLPGLQATWVRSFCVTGLRVGLYPTVRAALAGSDASSTSFASKAGAGMATGALSAALANPIDMVRTRIHAQVGLPTRYASSAAAALAIVRDEGGLAALWRGVGATVARQALLSGGQLASYDALKQAARDAGAPEGPALHLGCAGASGVVGQLCCMPADVIKVKVLSGDYGASVLGCVAATLRTEGVRPHVMRVAAPVAPRAPRLEETRLASSLDSCEQVLGFYRGLLPGVARQCPVILARAAVQMPLIEEIRRLAGLGHI